MQDELHRLRSSFACASHAYDGPLLVFWRAECQSPVKSMHVVTLGQQTRLLHTDECCYISTITCEVRPAHAIAPGSLYRIISPCIVHK
jgi:hypothetical protein